MKKITINGCLFDVCAMQWAQTTVRSCSGGRTIGTQLHIDTYSHLPDVCAHCEAYVCYGDSYDCHFFCFQESDTLDCVPYQKQATHTQHQILYRFLYFRFVLHPNVNVFYDRSVALDTTVADARFYFFWSTLCSTGHNRRRCAILFFLMYAL